MSLPIAAARILSFGDMPIKDITFRTYGTLKVSVMYFYLTAIPDGIFSFCSDRSKSMVEKEIES